MLARANDDRTKPFGKVLSEHGVMLERIAQARIEIDAARLVVLNAAVKIDEGNAKAAMKEIAAAKVFVPQVTGRVIDNAVQSYGAQGVSQDTPLASMWATSRIIRIADGPDEVHLQQLGRKENQRARDIQQSLDAQVAASKRILASYNLEQALGVSYGRRTSKL
jgi:acyl-CoA dehydrogenase